MDQPAHPVGDVVDQIQQTAGQAIEGAKQTGGQVVASARQQTTSRLTGVKDQAAGMLGDVAQAVRQTGQRLQADHAGMAGYTMTAADRVEQVSGYLRDRDIDTLGDETGQFARRQPAVFVGAAFTLGLVAARFLKSSRQQAEVIQARAAARQRAEAERATARARAAQAAQAAPLLSPPTAATTGASNTGSDTTGASNTRSDTTSILDTRSDMTASSMAGAMTIPNPVMTDESGVAVGDVTTDESLDAAPEAEEYAPRYNGRGPAPRSPVGLARRRGAGMQNSSPDDRSLGELFGQLAQESSTLVRQEMALDRAELTQKATQTGKDIGVLAVGGVIAFAGFLALMAAVILALAAVLPAWLAALIVGIVVAAVGYVLVQRGLAALKHENLTPHQTIDTVKGDLDALKGGRT